ncbi:GNAT family N-acetyltransferase [Salinibacterium sp. UTAS2018]|uniref:GNAT family N-acetyltransferase n=1 Tax=Salinibacterium sp. UTAS2018 TaxID=2508880 RepID=UPI0010095D02|nr:GNAT family N-acetyltransferase [Salinibacterium sp. UTAS2018]QAV71111.1 GNAT family N-acetyltransferase [Salinibacterium sp. UTAS2018]
MTTLIRRAFESDAELLHELARQTFPLACPPGTTAEGIAAFISEHLSANSFTQYLNDSSREILISEVDGEASGYVMFCVDEPTDPDVAAALTVRPTVELSKCYVLGQFHGSGSAAALVSAGIDWARDREFAAVWLGVNQENARANRFYEKMGFELVGTKKFLVGGRWEDDFVRQLTLLADSGMTS